MEDKLIDFYERVKQYNNQFGFDSENNSESAEKDNKRYKIDWNKVLDGHVKKEFVRFNISTSDFNNSQVNSYNYINKAENDNEYLSRLFTAFSSGKCSYVTYFDEMFKNVNKEDMNYPEYVSCLLKYYDGAPFICFSEVAGSRLANYLGVDTVYNESFSRGTSAENKPDTILSVDCVPSGYTIEAFDIININFDIDTPLQNILEDLYYEIYKICSRFQLTLTPERLERLSKQIVKQYIFRNLICEDGDFRSKNMVLMMEDYNSEFRAKNGDFYLGPCLDYEMIFSGSKPQDFYKIFARQNVAYLKGNFPGILEEMLERLTEGIRNHEIREILNTSMADYYDIVHIINCNKIFNRIKKNATILRELVSEYDLKMEEFKSELNSQ